MEERLNFRILGIIAFILGVIHNILFFDHGLGINVPIFVLVAIAGGILLTLRFNTLIRKEHIAIFLIPAFVFSTMVFVRASELLTFFNLVAVVFLLSIFAASFLQKNIRLYLPMDYVRIALLPLHFIKSFFGTISKMLNFSKISRENPITIEVIRGSIIAVIAISLFSLLFASADDVFRKLFLDLRFIELDSEPFIRLILIVIVSSVFISAFGYMFSKGMQKEETRVSSKRTLGKIETMIILGGINLLFLLFIILQFAY